MTGFKTRGKRIFFIFFFLVPFTFIADFHLQNSLYAENSSTGDSGLTITPVTITPVEAPTVTAPTAPVISGTETTKQKNTEAASASKSASTEKTAGESSVNSSAGSTALSLLGLGSNNTLLQALSGSSEDTSSLNALSSLLGLSSDTDSTDSMAASSSSLSDTAVLEKILAILEKQQKDESTAGAVNASAAVAAKAVASTGKSSETNSDSKSTPRITSGAELIRFTINGYNLAATTTTLVSSILAKDGSFLLTGDRNYISGNKRCYETFYLLCRKTGENTYRLFCDVSQNFLNEYSYLYRLTHSSPLDGTLTGDVLVFRNEDPTWQLNLVFRLVKPDTSG